MINSGTSPKTGWGYMDVHIGETPPTLIRYTSGQVIYVESSDGGKWSGRYWSADGRIKVPYESWSAEAFQLGIDHKLLSADWSVKSAEEVEKTKRGSRHIVVALTHQDQPIKVNVHTLLDGTPVLTRWLDITNTGEKSLPLTEVKPWSGRLWPGRNFTLGYFTEDIWACEGWFNWKSLPLGATRVRSDKGQGHDDPFFIVRNEVTGEYFIGHLAWTANWIMEFIRDDFGLTFKAGPDAIPVQRVVAPGETVSTPAVHIGHTSGSFDSAVQAMHDHLRISVLPEPIPERAHRIQYLVPADQGYHTPFDERSALKCVDVAAEIGAELFLLDAYWWDITPDWFPSPERFPNGLEPVIKRVREKGMLFGLYVETEAGRGRVKESTIYQQHPEWFGPKNVLKLTIPEAAAWTESEIRRLIEQYELDLYRVDYNPSFTYDGPTTERDSIVENNYWRYYDVFYNLYEGLRKDYPKLILQQCAAGGARNDLGTASRFHEIYLTDGLSLPRELQVYSGLTLGLPPEVLLILHGADGGRGMGKPQSLDTILRMSFATSIPQIFVGTVAPSVEELSPLRKARFLHYRKIYTEFIRPLLPTCKVFHHEPVNAHGGVESSPWFAMEYTAPDRTQGWAFIARMRNGKGDLYVHKYHNQLVDDIEVIPPKDAYEGDTYILKPRGLDPANNYRVTYDSLSTAVSISGLELVRQGLSVRLENAGMSELLLFEEV
ncbi:MAG: alpha-galactosidase [Anaerolineales bacterium]|jgi:alpha-galactosidase